jgi:predicted dehydrogenase
MAKRIPTVGIIGLGFGRAHIPAFQANGAEVVAVCQRDQATARAVADKYGVPRVFEKWQDMLAEAHPEIVVIASPPHLHHAIALAAFAGGAHVLCEKPLAMTAAEGRDMVEAAARAGRIGMTSFNWRFGKGRAPPRAPRRTVARSRTGKPGFRGARGRRGRAPSAPCSP